MDGLWRGKVVRVETNDVWVSSPSVAGGEFLGPTEPIPGVTLVVGDGVLFGFAQGEAHKIELVRKTV